MANKNINMPFDQIPHLVLECKELTSDQKIIMIYLYKILKDNDMCIYTNLKISKNSGIPLRTVERGINNLTKLGFIFSLGAGYRRRIYVGQRFDNSATMAVNKLNNSATMAGDTATMAVEYRHNGGDYNKSLIKSITNVCVDALRPHQHTLIFASLQKEFNEKFNEYELSIEELFESCQNHYKGKKEVTEQLFQRWIRNEQVTSYKKKEAPRKLNVYDRLGLTEDDRYLIADYKHMLHRPGILLLSGGKLEQAKSIYEKLLATGEEF